MILGGDGPAVVLSAEDAALLRRAVLDELARVTTRNGAPSPRLVAIARDVETAAKWLRNNRRSTSQATRLRMISETDAAAESGTVSTTEAAALIGVSTAYMRRLCVSGVVHAHRGPGGAWRVDRSAAVAFAEQRNAAA